MLTNKLAINPINIIKIAVKLHLPHSHTSLLLKDRFKGTAYGSSKSFYLHINIFGLFLNSTILIITNSNEIIKQFYGDKYFFSDTVLPLVLLII